MAAVMGGGRGVRVWRCGCGWQCGLVQRVVAEFVLRFGAALRVCAPHARMRKCRERLVAKTFLTTLSLI